MKRVINYLRIKEWLSSKVSFMLGVILLFLFCTQAQFDAVLVKVAVYFLYVSMFLAISYVVNDFADMDVDRKAGKKKVIADLPKWLIWVSLFVMAAIGNVPVFLCAVHKTGCIAMMALTYFCGLAYSTLGIRFKERGVWGLIECSFAQKCMPLLMIPFLVKLDGSLLVMFAGWIVLSFVDGLRYIIIHQVNDMENDLASGVNTFVIEKRGNYRKLVVDMLLILFVMTCVLLLPLWVKQTLLTLIVFLLNLCLEYCIYIVIQKLAKKDFFMTFDSVPMEAFFNIFLPVLAGLSMIGLDIRWLFVVLFIVAICIRPLVVKFRIAAVFIESKMKKSR